MVENMSKKEFVETLLDAMTENCTEDDANEYISAFLNSKLKNGKLYKYRSFSEYSIDNLKNNTLYCSKPSEFNDPFDCKIGIDLETYFDTVNMNYFYRAENLIFAFFENDSILNNLSEKEISLVNKWRKEIVDYNIYDNKNDDFNMLLFKMVIDYFNEHRVFGDSTINFDDCKNIIEKMIENSDKFGEEESFDKTLDNLMGIENIECGGDQISKMTELVRKIMPDKYDLANRLNFDLNEIIRDLSNKIDEQWKVCCLSENYDNTLMWSHYADDHKGFCIEYDFTLLKEMGDRTIILPVIYDSKRVKFPWNIALNMNTGNNKNEGGIVTLLSLLTKDKLWEYENEWRILLLSNKNKNIIMPKISCVYLGVCCSEEHKKVIMSIAEKNNIPVKQMVLDRGEYKLLVQSI